MPTLATRNWPRFSWAMIAAMLAALPGSLHADNDSSDADKWGYSLFKPTPGDLLRPMSLDASDGVIDPTTVDAGHVQLQGSLDFDYHSGHHYYPPEVVDGGKYEYSGRNYHYTDEAIDVNPRLTIGLFNNVDLFIHPEYKVSWVKDTGDYFLTPGYAYAGGGAVRPLNYSETLSVFENINVGTKINLWGNDGGTTALALAPFVSIPTDHGDILGGGDIAFAVRLPRQWYVKVDVNPAIVANGAGTTYLNMEDNLSVHKALDENFDVFAYINTTWDSEPGEGCYGYAGLGTGYQLSRNLEVFGSFAFGFQVRAYNYSPRLGLAWRF